METKPGTSGSEPDPFEALTQILKRPHLDKKSYYYMYQVTRQFSEADTPVINLLNKMALQTAETQSCFGNTFTDHLVYFWVMYEADPKGECKRDHGYLLSFADEIRGLIERNPPQSQNSYRAHMLRSMIRLQELLRTQKSYPNAARPGLSQRVADEVAVLDEMRQAAAAAAGTPLLLNSKGSEEYAEKQIVELMAKPTLRDYEYSYMVMAFCYLAPGKTTPAQKLAAKLVLQTADSEDRPNDSFLNHLAYCYLLYVQKDIHADWSTMVLLMNGIEMTVASTGDPESVQEKMIAAFRQEVNNLRADTDYPYPAEAHMAGELQALDEMRANVRNAGS